MILTITINMDGDAFDRYPTIEAARILDRLAGDIETDSYDMSVHNGKRLRDINGNTVGTVEVSE